MDAHTATFGTLYKGYMSEVDPVEEPSFAYIFNVLCPPLAILYKRIHFFAVFCCGHGQWLYESKR